MKTPGPDETQARKSVRIQVIMAPVIAQQIEELAQAWGMSDSECARALILRALEGLGRLPGVKQTDESHLKEM